MNSPLPSSRIMLVEDDPRQADLYAGVLRRHFRDDVELVVFVDSVRAAAYLQDNLVDVLITDLRMPNVDGLELIRRAKERHHGLQVLVMTAASTADSIVEAVELEADDYLLKPFDIDVLIELVDQARRRLNRWREALAGTLHHDSSTFDVTSAEQ